MNRSPQPVRNFSLYGERDLMPDVLHCETIAQRSLLHDWELAPHRHDHLHQFLLLRSGSGSARLEERLLDLPPMTLVNVPPGDVHAFTFEPGTQGLVLTLADTLRDELLAHDPPLRRLLGHAWVGPAEAELDALAGRIAHEFAGRATARALLLRGQAASLLAQAARVAEQLAPVQAGVAESQLLKRFEALLEAHFLKHWRVSDYADALAVTPTHLSRVLRQAQGQPASRVIDARVVREARRWLVYTPMPVTVIADALGFTDPALFSRVFSRVAGCSPRAFRERLAAARHQPGLP